MSQGLASGPQLSYVPDFYVHSGLEGNGDGILCGCNTVATNIAMEIRVRVLGKILSESQALLRFSQAQLAIKIPLIHQTFSHRFQL